MTLPNPEDSGQAPMAARLDALENALIGLALEIGRCDPETLLALDTRLRSDEASAAPLAAKEMARLRRAIALQALATSGRPV